PNGHALSYASRGCPGASGGMADAHGSGPCVRKDVRVQLPPRPPETTSLSGCEREVVLFVAEVRYLTGLVTRLWDAPGPGDRSSLHGRVAVHHAANLDAFGDRLATRPGRGRQQRGDLEGPLLGRHVDFHVAREHLARWCERAAGDRRLSAAVTADHGGLVDQRQLGDPLAAVLQLPAHVVHVLH